MLWLPIADDTKLLHSPSNSLPQLLTPAQQASHRWHVLIDARTLQCAVHTILYVCVHVCTCGDLL